MLRTMCHKLCYMRESHQRLTSRSAVQICTQNGVSTAAALCVCTSSVSVLFAPLRFHYFPCSVASLYGPAALKQSLILLARRRGSRGLIFSVPLYRLHVTQWHLNDRSELSKSLIHSAFFASSVGIRSRMPSDLLLAYFP